MADPSALSSASVAWSVASGAALALLGGVLLAAPVRPRGTVPFAGFALLWGAHVALGNLAGSGAFDLAASEVLLLAALATVLPTGILVLEFGAAQDGAASRIP
ncbi:MAG: hypothetical protein ACT4PT_09035, partial [Methanobacteriota archaeon]